MDLYLEKCLKLAQNSKANVRFGSFIEKNGEILGCGWNRISYLYERKLYRVDYCTHAEEAALFKALVTFKNFEGAILYVSGFLKNGDPFLRDKAYFTCRRCAGKVLLPFDLPVKVLTKSGWHKLNPEEAYDCSIKFFKQGFWGNVAKNGSTR